MKLWDINEENAYEKWDILDKDGNKLSYTKFRREDLNKNEYHLVVRAWIINSCGEILLSQRGGNKRGAFLWECTAGSALSGETSKDAINREVYEELSIDLSECSGTLVKRIRRDEHHDFYEIWIFKKDIKLNEIKYDGQEVVAVKWVDINELEQMILDGKLMPTLSNFPQLYKEYMNC